ncbi:hypothetical protein ACLBX9_07065 [Methylobacterium sp. A49B]
MSKTDAALAAILSIEPYDYEQHDELARVLAPHVVALPLLREWSEDEPWTAAEETQSAARRFVELHANPYTQTDPWLSLENLRKRLAAMQQRHRENTALEELGEFPGYKARAQHWYGEWKPKVSLWRAEDSPDFSPAILTLPTGTSRDVAKVMLSSWEAGYSRGKRDSVTEIRTGMRELLQWDD